MTEYSENTFVSGMLHCPVCNAPPREAVSIKTYYHPETKQTRVAASCSNCSYQIAVKITGKSADMFRHIRSLWNIRIT